METTLEGPRSFFSFFFFFFLEKKNGENSRIIEMLSCFGLFEGQARLGVGADELARITTKRAFLDAGLDDLDKLSFEEFAAWYEEGAPSMSAAVPVPVPSSRRDDETPLERLSRASGLARLDVGDAMRDLLARADREGHLDREAFTDSLNALRGDADESLNKNEPASRARARASLFLS